MTEAIDRRVPRDQTGAWCVSAPVRIDFTGGYTDVPPVTDDHDGYSVNAAIALPTHVCARPRDDRRVRIHSENLGTTIEAASAAELRSDGTLNVVKQAIRSLELPHGLRITLRSEAPFSCGIGSSGALAVAMSALVHRLRGRALDAHAVAAHAVELERAAGIAGGTQDQVAAAYGGFSFIVSRAGSIRRASIPLSAAAIGELERRLILAHPGGSRFSGNLVEQINERYLAGDRDVRGALRALNELAPALRDTIAGGDHDGLGEGLKEVRIQQKRLHPDITDARVERIFGEMRRIGVDAGKALGGAGPGACLLFLCPPDLRDAACAILQREGCRVLPLVFDTQGVRSSLEP